MRTQKQCKIVVVSTSGSLDARNIRMLSINVYAEISLNLCSNLLHCGRFNRCVTADIHKRQNVLLHRWADVKSASSDVTLMLPKCISRHNTHSICSMAIAVTGKKETLKWYTMFTYHFYVAYADRCYVVLLLYCPHACARTRVATDPLDRLPQVWQNSAWQ